MLIDRERPGWGTPKGTLNQRVGGSSPPRLTLLCNRRRRRPLLSQLGKPSVQDRQAAWLNRSERDPHSAVLSRIGYLALGHEVHARVRNSQSDLCSGWERSSGLNKTSEHTQILGVRCKLLFRHDVRDLNPSNKGEALRSMMPSRRDQVGDLV